MSSERQRQLKDLADLKAAAKVLAGPHMSPLPAQYCISCLRIGPLARGPFYRIRHVDQDNVDKDSALQVGILDHHDIACPEGGEHGPDRYRDAAAGDGEALHTAPWHG